MGLFGRKTVIIETDEKKAKKQLYKMIRSSFNSQKSYKVFLRAGTLGLLKQEETVPEPNTIYCFHQGKLLRVPRKGSIW